MVILYTGMIQLAYECTEDKDDVDNHEHFNCSETICLKCFGYTKNREQQQQTFGILLVMLLKILTRTRKTVTRIVILPGTLSGGTRKLGKDLINYFLKKKMEAEKRIYQLCWNPFSPQESQGKLERIRSTFQKQYFTWSRIRWQTCRLENSRWWCSGTFSSSESAGSQWQSNFLGRGNFDIYRPQYIL